MTEKILIIAFIVMFVWHTLQEGEIFGKVGESIKDIIGEFYAKPIVGCSVCMTPWWGSLVYILIWGVNVQWPIVVLSAAGLNAIIVRLWPG